MKLASLHESFIERARRQMTFGQLPIDPVKGDVAIIAVSKWETLESPRRMRKKFSFMSQDARNKFVVDLLEYEQKIGHNAMMTIDEDSVTLDLRTKDIDQVTELDKEYASFADVLFKDIVYNSSSDEF